MEVSAQPPASAPINPLPPKKRPFVIIGGFLLIFIVGFVLSALLSANRPATPIQNPGTTVATPAPTKVSAISPGVTTAESRDEEHGLVYTKDRNLFMLSTTDFKEVPITTDGSNLIYYRLPQWIDKRTISYVRCVNKDEQQTQAYSCSLLKKDLQGGGTTDLLSLTSKTNTNGSQIGGSFFGYGWNSKKTQAAVLIHDVTDDSKDFGIVRLLLVNSQDRSTRELDRFSLSGGRGGMLDDDISLHFTPDGKKLLVNNTTLGATNRGTMFVYDTSTGSVLWQQPNRLTTFGRFITNETFIAKQLPETTGNANVIQVMLSPFSLDYLTVSQGWYTIMPLTEDELIFWSLRPEGRRGVTMERFNKRTKQRALLAENVLPVGVLSTTRIAVQKLRPCDFSQQECPLDVYNGYTQDHLGILDLETQQVKEIRVTDPQTIGNIAVR